MAENQEWNGEEMENIFGGVSNILVPLPKRRFLFLYPPSWQRQHGRLLRR
jgi:hypothetical protein